MKAYRRSAGIAPLLNLDTRWRRMVNFMPPAALPLEGTPELIEEVGGPRSWSGRLGENFVSAGIVTLDHLVYSLVICQLRCPGYNTTAIIIIIIIIIIKTLWFEFEADISTAFQEMLST
jgi:hypothetical protein